MRRCLQSLLLALGSAAVAIALLHIAIGPAAIPGAVPVNATMDSEDRFYAAMFAGFGLALLWCARDVRRRGRCVRFLSAVFFLGGLARLVSVARVGLPSAFFTAMTAIELGLPPLLWWLQSRVEQAVPGPGATR